MESIEQQVDRIKSARITDRDGSVVEGIDPAASEVELETGEIVSADTRQGALEEMRAELHERNRQQWAWN